MLRLRAKRRPPAHAASQTREKDHKEKYPRPGMTQLMEILAAHKKREARQGIQTERARTVTFL